MLKSIYRREPIVSFAITIGAVDAALGGLSEHWSLLWFGLGLAGTGIALRWWQAQRHHSIAEDSRPPAYILPPHSSRPSLPMLSMSKKTPPGRF
jgi:hypothetical protein